MTAEQRDFNIREYLNLRGGKEYVNDPYYYSP